MVSIIQRQHWHLVQTLTFMRRLVGIYCMIFAAFVKIRLKKTNSGSKALLYLIIANFIACTAFIAVDVSASQTNASFGLVFVENVLYMCIDLFSQIILVNFLTTYDSFLHH